MKASFLLLSLLVLNTASAQSPQLAWANAIRAEVDHGREDGKHMAIDIQGNVYTTGSFRNTVDFDPGPGTFDLTANGSNGYPDIYVQKLDAAGNFLWARSIGGYGGDFVDGIALDAAGNVCIVGGLDSTADFDPGPGSYTLTATPSYYNHLFGSTVSLTRATSSFICKLNSSGDFAWARKLDNTDAVAVATDRAGNIYTTGYFRIHADFDPGPGTFLLTPAAPDSSAFYLLKLNSLGDFTWAKQVLSSGAGAGDGLGIPGLQVDATGNIYTCGTFEKSGDFDPGAGTFNMTARGYSDAFISKLDSAGNLVWAKKVSGSGGDLGQSLTLDAFGNLFFIGAFQDTADLDPGPATANHISAGDLDGFIVKLDTGGNYKWSKSFGGRGDDFYNTIRTDAWGNIYAGGGFEDTVDFDPGPGMANRSAYGFEPDGFIIRLDSSGIFGWVTDIGRETYNGVDFCWNLEVDGVGNVYATGGFSDTVDFDPGAGTKNLVAGYSETFVMKLSQPGLAVAPLLPLKDACRLYPNPTLGIIVIESSVSLQDARIRVIDLCGRVKSSSSEISGKSVTLDIHQEPAGMYVIEVTHDGGSVQRLRIVKQ